ncbi:Rv0361 family membrane protein [Tsukamurella tyrosinosolvens]|uniref:Rv0361 family membrane protein n=1 Tax=Tsukamurella tyrosinosolvens TaxID=57704 RepID=UPI002DD43AA4|nr:hypothetical protein [Tsukamurella tyrosinosolvens]MEC4616427.1 hypothetical protein [Tsukamurella tyrosinosolvens]
MAARVSWKARTFTVGGIALALSALAAGCDSSENAPKTSSSAPATASQDLANAIQGVLDAYGAADRSKLIAGSCGQLKSDAESSSEERFVAEARQDERSRGRARVGNLASPTVNGDKAEVNGVIYYDRYQPTGVSARFFLERSEGWKLCSYAVVH